MNFFAAILKGIGVLSRYLSPFVGGVTQVAPAAGTTFGTIVTILGTIEQTAQVFNTAEGTGVQKLEAATPLIADVIKHSELVAGRDVVDEAKFLDGVKQIVSGTVAVLNSIKH